MGSSANFGCSAGCGSIPVNGAPAMLSVIVQNGTSIRLQGMTNILLDASKAYLVEYNADFTTASSNHIIATELRLNGKLIPGSQSFSFPTTIPFGQNTPTANATGGAIFNTPSSPNPSILQLIGFSPVEASGSNFSGVNIRVTEIDNFASAGVTRNNAAIFSYGYENVGPVSPVPFLAAKVANGSGITFSTNNRTVIDLAPNATYFASYSFIESPLMANLSVLVQLTLNGIPLDQSLSVAPSLADGVSRSGGAGSAVFNTGPGTNKLQLMNMNVQEIKFVSANVNIIQVG